MSMYRRFCLSLVVVSCAASGLEAAVLRVGSWNVANNPNDPTEDANLRTILTHINTTRPLDVLAMVEADLTNNTSIGALSIFGGSYAQALVPTADGGGDRTGFIYNTATLSLVSSVVVGQGTITHPSLRAQFRPIGTSGADDFYLYAVHLQSGSSSAIKTQRVNQAQVLRTDADALGSANVIFGGDFNWQKADDVSAGVGAYRTFNAAGPGQAFDPVNAVGDWHNNPAYKSLHSNDPGGSMDDRFDMQLISGELRDGLGLDYLAGSYNVLGNNGTHTLGSTITTGTGAPAPVLNALASFSDHLPVLADYTFNVPEPASALATMTMAWLMLRRR